MPTTAKKPAAKSKATTATKKPAVHKKATAAHAKHQSVRSFQLSPETKPFLTPAVSVQTFYWVVIGVLVLLLASWSMYLTVQIQGIYDNVTATDTIVVTPHKK
jgi:hypothetical protein